MADQIDFCGDTTIARLRLKRDEAQGKSEKASRKADKYKAIASKFDDELLREIRRRNAEEEARKYPWHDLKDKRPDDGTICEIDCGVRDASYTFAKYISVFDSFVTLSNYSRYFYSVHIYKVNRWRVARPTDIPDDCKF